MGGVAGPLPWQAAHDREGEGGRAARAEVCARRRLARGANRTSRRLKAFHRYPGSEFGSPDELAKQIAYSAILDLLVADYAEKEVRERDVAEGFIREMAKRVAGDKALDLDGMKQAVRNAIEIYEKEIARTAN